MSWQEREGLRRELLRYTLPDRELHTPSVARPLDRNVRRFEDEWKTGRLAVQPAAIMVNLAAQWPFEPDPIDEESAGTYYTNYVDLENGPVATGLFSCPESTLTLAEDDASVYLELFDEDDDTTSVLVAALTTDGEATRTGAGYVLFSLTSGKQIVKARYRVESGGAVAFSSSGSLIWYGGQ
jgi:hypothetical protein